MVTEKEMELIRLRGKEGLIKFEFQYTLSIKLEAIREVENDEFRLTALKELYNEYSNYVTEWYKLFGIANDPDITKVFKPTDLLKDKGIEYFHKLRLEFAKSLQPIGKEIQKLEFKKSILTTQNKIVESKKNENNSLKDFPEIFKDNGYEVFIQLNEKYQKNNKTLKTKFSNLFHFLEYSELIRCAQIEYIEFIWQNYSVKLSKILPKTAKYEDVIQPLLMKYHKGQQ